MELDGLESKSILSLQRSYLYKENYGEEMPFKKVNILKNKKIIAAPKDIEIEKSCENYYGTNSDKKKKTKSSTTDNICKRIIQIFL